jgi:hypothetical protein
MITVDTLKKCSWLNSLTLQELLRKKYPEDHVLTSEFIGITNSGQFCYNIGYQDIDLAGQGLTYCKVFVRVSDTGEVVAEY